MATTPAIPNSDRFVSYSPVVPTSAFIIPWVVIADSEILAEDDLTVVVNGVVYTSAQFSFAGNAISGLSGEWNGGTVTLTAAVSGVRVLIYSERDPRRTGSFLEGKALQMTALDQLQDDITVMIRDVHLATKRSFQVPVQDVADGISLDVPAGSARAGKYWAFDGVGKTTMASGTGNDSALRTDLASSSNGDALISVKRASTGSVAQTLNDWIESGAKSPAEFGCVGSGDESVKLQAWLDAIPTGGCGVLPPGVAYTFGTGLTRNNYISIIGGGYASRLNYTGSGVAFNGAGLRFSRLQNFLLVGTASALGGMYIRSAQEGYFDNGVFVENFSGAGAYARRFSSCWTGVVLGGSAKACTNGLIFDTTNDSVSGVNNSFNIMGVDCSGCTGIGVDFQKGFRASIVGCDFSTTGTGIEIARALGAGDTARDIQIVGNYFESTHGIYIGRGAFNSGSAVYIGIERNYINGSVDGIHIYQGDSVVVGSQSMGAGINTIDAPVTGTVWASENNVTDNSAAGQTTYLRGSTGFIQTKQIVATSILDCPSYTVAQVAGLAATAHRIIYVSNESGGAVLAFSDGVNYRRVTDRAIVS